MSFSDDLSDALMGHLQQHGKRLNLVNGEQLIERGKESNALYFLESGELIVEIGSFSITIQAGDVVGEIGFLDNLPRTANVFAKTNCSLLTFEREATLKSLENKPLLLDELIKALKAKQHKRLLVTDFSKPLRLQLQRVGQWRSLAEGEVLIRRGDTGSTAFLVISGGLTVSVPFAPVFIEMDGVVGEMAFLENHPRRADVIAAEPTEVLAFERNKTFQSLSHYPDLLKELIQSLDLIQRSRRKNPIFRDSRSAQDFMDRLQREISRHRSIPHPYLKALANGSHPNPLATMKDFIKNYKVFMAQFPHCLAILISRIENQSQRQKVLGIPGLGPLAVDGDSHPELINRLSDVLSIDQQEEDSDALAEVINWRDDFISLLRDGTFAQAIGAMGPGSEALFPDLYRQLRACCETLGLAQLLPMNCDEKHANLFIELAKESAENPALRSDLRMGALRALALRAAFFDFMHQRALDGGAPEV